MKTVRNIALFLFVVLSLFILWALWKGQGWLEVDQLLSYPWFIVSLVDVYTGFILFCLWVWFRESSVLLAIAISVLIMVLGNVVSCLYVILQLKLSGGRWDKFWLGVHAGSR